MLAYVELLCGTCRHLAPKLHPESEREDLPAFPWGNTKLIGVPLSIAMAQGGEGSARGDGSTGDKSACLCTREGKQFVVHVVQAKSWKSDREIS